MEPLKDTAAYYFTKEDVSNFKLKIILRQLTSADLVDVTPRVAEEENSSIKDNDEILLKTLKSRRKKSHDLQSQQKVITWQEKILSPTEVQEYQRPQYRNDSKYRSRYLQAKNQKNKSQEQNRIFTYTLEDDFKNKKEEATTSIKNQSNKNSEKGDINSTSAVQKQKQYPKESFYIMADLAPSDRLCDSKEYEVILCEIKYDRRGQLTINPDINNHNHAKPYRIENTIGGSMQYEYTIENVSDTKSAEDIHQENILCSQLVKQKLDDYKLPEFEENVTSGETRLIIMGEILRAYNFNTSLSSLYVKYLLHCPTGWRVNEGCETEGFTASSRTVYDGNYYVAHFSTPIYIDVTRTKSDGCGVPVLLFGVYSVDWWTRDRDEGFSTFNLPFPENVLNNDMGIEKVHIINTWRPCQVNPSDKLRRHFLGGSQLIADYSYLTTDTKDSGSRMSRLGFQTETSGTIEFRLQAMVQTSPDYQKDSFKQRTGWQLSTQIVLEAFQKTCKKLKDAKKGL